MSLNNLKTAALASIGFLSAVSSAQLVTQSNAFSPTGISGDGSTVVGQTGSGAAYWTLGVGLVNIGGVAVGTVHVSDDGSKIGASMAGPANIYTSTGWTEMGIYDRNTSSWANYGHLNYHSGTTASSAWGISGDGKTVLGQAYYNTTAAGGTAARVNPTISSTVGEVATDLDPNTVNNGRIQASNFDGSILGGYDRGSGFGSIWENGVINNITGVYNGSSINLGVVEDISSNGRWVIGDGNSTSQYQSYIYDRTTGTAKFTPNPWLANAERATVVSVSGDGRWVFGRYLKNGFSPFVDAHMFVWDTQLDSVTLLNDLAANEGINLGGLNLTLPCGMSDDGSTFTGMGAGASATQTFYLHLNSVPEPGSIAVMAIGVLGLFSKKRRK